MNAVKVDTARRIRLRVLNPGDYYEPEVLNADQITLRRVRPPQRKLTKTQALHAIRKSSLTFSRSWEEMRRDTREP